MSRTYEKSPTIDGTFFYIGNTWSDAGDGATAISANTTFKHNSSFLTSIDISDSNITQIHRAAIEFDTSDITEVPESATIKLYGTGSLTSANIRIIGVEASFASDGAIVAGDFDSWNEASPVNYTDVLGVSASIGSAWNDSGYNTFTLTAAAKSAMASQDVIQIMWLEYDNDYDRTSSGGTFGSNVSIQLGAAGRNSENVSARPVLTYTLAPLPGKLNISGGNLTLKGSSLTIK
tara:strand:+ start:84 stop:785 length:702 start_codon:yes stop_codon:yes gene_type:complete